MINDMIIDHISHGWFVQNAQVNTCLSTVMITTTTAHQSFLVFSPVVELVNKKKYARHYMYIQIIIFFSFHFFHYRNIVCFWRANNNLKKYSIDIHSELQHLVCRCKHSTATVECQPEESNSFSFTQTTSKEIIGIYIPKPKQAKNEAKSMSADSLDEPHNPC